MKVVLIDDEIPVIDALRSTLQRLGRATVVGCAGNGLRGLELIANMRPDLAFVDIQMPVMDGLELAMEVKRRGLPTRVVILTAYQQFDYAQKGIAAGVTAYLLKHRMDDKRLDEILSQVEGELARAHEVVNIPKKSALSVYIRGDGSDRGLDRAMGEGRERYLLLLAHVMRPLWRPPGMDPEPCAIQEAGFAACAGQLGLELVHFMPYRSGAVAALFSEPAEPERSFRSRLERFVQARCGQGSDLIRCAALHRELSLGQLARAAAWAWAWLGVHNWQEERPLLYVKAAPQPGEAPGIHAALAAILEGNLEKAQHMMEDLRKGFKGGDMMTAAISAAVNSLMLVIDSHLFKHRANPEPPAALYTVDGAMDMLRSRLLQALDGPPPAAMSHKLKLALGFIKDHYCRDDLNQQQVADYIGVTSVYLSTLFRRELNVSFLDYVTQMRVEKAKYYLRQTNLKIYEVAQLVGYQTSQYFGRVFRQKVGLTPAEYREDEEAR